MHAETEGVIKFDLRYTPSSLGPECDISRLEAARNRLFAARLIGRDSARYEGLGYGNISERWHDSDCFVISGSQTGGFAHLTLDEYALVTAADVEHNILVAEGCCKPSSESLTHALIYQLDPAVKGVVHVHCPELWQAAERLHLPCTPASVPYGSLAMVLAVRHLWDSGQLDDMRGFVMLGHQDGIVTFGDGLEQATNLLFEWLDRV
jgi:L-ribulose-5-phosphate 4-epimerase